MVLSAKSPRLTTHDQEQVTQLTGFVLRTECWQFCPYGGAMIELIIAACLAAGECRESRLAYDANDVSLMTCVVAGQTEVARWQQQHPAWRIKSWRCTVARQDGWVL
jgi:hypothetical protein